VQINGALRRLKGTIFMDTTKRINQHQEPTIFDTCKDISAKDAADKAGIKLKKSGGKYWANCFMHTDKTPSMAFYDIGSFYCFSCKAGGDAVTLYKLLYGLSPVDAAKRLLSDFGRSSEHLAARPPVKRITAYQIKDATELIKERRISELLATKRMAQSQIDLIEQKGNLSEEEQQKVFELVAVTSAADSLIARLDLYPPAELVEWAAKGAKFNDI
jgi:hypothetical protein